jgi:hypothetical protein
MTSTATHTERDEPLPPPDAGDVGAREQLRWFGTLWVMAMVFHHTDSHPTGAITVLLFAAPLLIWPTSAPAMMLFVGSIAVTAASNLPGIANHMVLNLLVGLGFATAALWVLVTDLRARRAGSPSAGSPSAGSSSAGSSSAGSSSVGSFGVRWFEAARTPIGLTLVAVYGFTVFHKLNTAFFDPINSCAGHLIDQMFEVNGLSIPDFPPALITASAVGTIIVETAILVSLAVPKLRRWGLILGVGFHSVLGWASFYDFATAVFAIYLLLVPTRAFAQVATRFPNLRTWSLIAFVAHVTLSMTAEYVGSDVSTFGLRWHTVLVVTWCIAVLPSMVSLLWAAYTDGAPFPSWRWRPALLLFVPLLAFLNGATPYLGLKTVANYSMFSNIHTEDGHTNHLMPGISALQVLHFQDNPVTVETIDAPGSAAALPKWMEEDPPQVVPLQELRRVTQLWRDAGVVGAKVDYLRDGVLHEVKDAVADPVLGAPMPWWQQKLMSFRALTSAEGPDICRW